MIIVTATLSFESEADRDRAVVATTPVQRATREEEPGCSAYCFAPDPVEPTHVQVFELWSDAEHLAAHFDHANYASMVRVLQSSGGFLASDNQLYAADDRGPVYGADGRFRFDAVADAGG